MSIMTRSWIALARIGARKSERSSSIIARSISESHWRAARIRRSLWKKKQSRERDTAWYDKSNASPQGATRARETRSTAKRQPLRKRDKSDRAILFAVLSRVAFSTTMSASPRRNKVSNRMANPPANTLDIGPPVCSDRDVCATDARRSNRYFSPLRAVMYTERVVSRGNSAMRLHRYGICEVTIEPFASRNQRIIWRGKNYSGSQIKGTRAALCFAGINESRRIVRIANSKHETLPFLPARFFPAILKSVWLRWLRSKDMLDSWRGGDSRRWVQRFRESRDCNCNLWNHEWRGFMEQVRSGHNEQRFLTSAGSIPRASARRRNRTTRFVILLAITPNRSLRQLAFSK